MAVGVASAVGEGVAGAMVVNRAVGVAGSAVATATWVVGTGVGRFTAKVEVGCKAPQLVSRAVKITRLPRQIDLFHRHEKR